MVQYLASLLSIAKNDRILDVCCGSGLITRELSKIADYVVGIDFSQTMLGWAKNGISSKLNYCLADAVEIPFKDHIFDKALLYYSFQYLNIQQGWLAISELSRTVKVSGVILIGDIPDRRKLMHYHRGLRERLGWLRLSLLRKDPMGRWWHPKELDKFCRKLGLSGKEIPQPSWLPHASYRFDYLIINRR